MLPFIKICCVYMKERLLLNKKTASLLGISRSRVAVYFFDKNKIGGFLAERNFTAVFGTNN